MNVIETIYSAFLAFLTQKYTLQDSIQKCDFSLNTDAQRVAFGDINSNIALLLAKPLGRSPRDIAHEISEKFKHPLVKNIEIAGPGFLNLFLHEEAFKTLAKELFEQKNSFFKKESSATRYNIEFVSANPTGPLHIGHGRGGIIGDVLGNVLKFLGYTVSKEHYINDAGSQMSKLGLSLKIRCQQEQGNAIEIPEDGYKGEYLKTLAQECIKEHGAKVLNQPDSFFLEYGYTHLLALLKNTVTSYNVIFDTWFSERVLHQGKIEQALARLTANGHTYEKDDALWFTSTKFGDDKDRVLKKSDGEYTYAAADVAYMLDKASRGFNHLVITLGQDHDSYPKRLEGFRQALGLDYVKLDCIIYQLVSIKEDGQQLRLSKRAGRIVGLADIIEEVGTDVARFFYLNRKADAHLEFDIALALSHTEENPVYYLQYAYVRTNSILEKAAKHPEFAHINADDSQYLTAQEQLLIKKMVELKSLLHSINHNYQVHLVAYYLLDLAHTFHNYYHHNRVIEPESIDQSRGRLFLVTLVKETFDRCLHVMGITRPEKM